MTAEGIEEEKDDVGCNVRVAVRIRPQLAREIINACKVCVTKTTNEQQIILGSNKAFTYDYVFDIDSQQKDVYDTTVFELVEGCFNGYNATVLAYGQTGSGKTYTMGTGFDAEGSLADDLHYGIIPRAVRQLFSGIKMRLDQATESGQLAPEFSVTAQFLELYNEEVIDLFDSTSKNKKSFIKIHEDAEGNIHMAGVTSRVVTNIQETMECLKIGAFNRTTASTNMNDQSSRSHAIFTLHIRQERQTHHQDTFAMETGSDLAKSSSSSSNESEILTAKFHFVDLAGSERLKRTGATGNRAKEGISINSGLLALGNVINALGDTTRKALHVPYRDSKLTRLLQDSLGGNSRTVMIACISPSDRDFVETLGTLKYANRARNIKNKVSANQDKSSRILVALRQEIQNLQLELVEYKQGKRLIDADGLETTNDMYHENAMLLKENQHLKTRVKALQETVEFMTAKNTQLITQKELAGEEWTSNSSPTNVATMVGKYVAEIEELRYRLCESEKIGQQLRSETTRYKRLSSNSFNLDDSNSNTAALIQATKADLKVKRQRKVRRLTAESNCREKLDTNGIIDGQEDDQNTGEFKNLPESGSDGDVDEDDEEEDDEDGIVNNADMDEELVELTSEISLRSRLLEEIENSQKRLILMKRQYESKLIVLQNRITTTENERDKVVKNMINKSGGGGMDASCNSDAVSRIRAEYKEKLENLKVELKKLQYAKREHAKLLRNQSQYERQVDMLKTEVATMKQNKVRLVQKMKEEYSRHREQEMRKNRELSNMKKEGRKRETLIRSLESERRMKESILKRRNEEVNQLRLNARRVPVDNGERRLIRTTPAAATSTKNNIKELVRRPSLQKSVKLKWQNIEKRITKVALNKQALSQMENDMDRWLKEREKLCHKLERMSFKRQRLAEKDREQTLLDDIDDQIENLKANINYLHENIDECQQSIVQMEQAGENGETEDEEEAITKLLDIEIMRPSEAKYLVNKLLRMTINQCCLATHKDSVIKETENRRAQAVKQNSLHQQLLQHMIEQQDLEVYDLMLASEQGDIESESDCESIITNMTSTNKTEKEQQEVSEENSSETSQSNLKEKARRKMTTKEDLLFTELGNERPPPTTFLRSSSFVKPASKHPMVRTRSFIKPSHVSLSNPMTQSMDQPTLEDRLVAASNMTAPISSGRNFTRKVSMSPRTMRKYNSTARIVESSSPPSSPLLGSVRRREETADKNVFNRLIAGTAIGEHSLLQKGNIHSFQGRFSSKSPLICSSIAEGHTMAVLSVFATEDMMFSASKDRTVKVWDISRYQEIQSLIGHPNNVVAVKYSTQSRLVFSVSAAFIKVWDLRISPPSSCIKTLSSSGLSNGGPLSLTSRSQSIPPGEITINDICLTPSGYGLFAAAGDKVRIWDLRKFHSIGKLSGGHQAAVMCLVSGPSSRSSNYVITGSKDHYIKVFDVEETRGGVVAPSKTLNPPHYDGIQSLAISGSTLFSASRDTCIKKWDLKNGALLRSLNNAHKDWVCGLAFLPGFQMIISGCRSGFLKLWSVENCSLVGEAKVHSSNVNTVATNSHNVFTGSNDGSVGIWMLRSGLDKRSPELENSCIVSNSS